MSDGKKFFEQFRFDQSRTGYVGVEREQFVLDPLVGKIVPHVPRYLSCISSLNGMIDTSRFNFGYELSACQLESKIGPCRLGEVRARLDECEAILSKVDSRVSMIRVNTELAPEDMPLDVYPDPTGRYQIITRSMPPEVLSAACRVAATHIHIGMPDLDTAIRAHDRAIAHVEELIKMGDGSAGKRMALYKVMAKRYLPEFIGSPDGLYLQAAAHNFLNDPRSCWTMVRVSIHGTVEFRMFGATDSHDKITDWVNRCHEICS